MSQAITRGFAANKSQAEDLAKFGVPENAIYLAGRGGESLEACLDSFRGRPGRLIVAHDLRVLGGTKRILAEISAKLEKAQIHVTDILHPEDTTVSEMLQRAQVAISGARFSDKRTARRHGSRGGLGKGMCAAVARDGIAERWLIDRIVDENRIPWAQKIELLKPHFSESTLRRHYGARNMGKSK